MEHLRVRGIPNFKIMPTFSLRLVRGFQDGTVTFANGSITSELSEIPGFLKTEPEFESDRPVIRVFGRDLACDLLEGNAKVRGSAPMEVRTGVNQAGLKSDLYFDIFGKIDSMGPITRGSKEAQLATVGARLGRQLDLAFPKLSDAEFESMVSDVFPLFFETDTLRTKTYQDISSFSDSVSPFLFQAPNVQITVRVPRVDQ